MKVLVVEDERDISNALIKLLKMNNYSCDAAYDGEEALDYLAYDEYDAVILDIMMPKKNGIEVLKEIRSNNNNVPVLMLTAKSELDDKVKGLDSGADDYLTKPFSSEELLARVKALLRRKEKFTGDLLSYNDLSIDRDTFELICGQKRIVLGKKEFQILEMLLLNQGRILNKSVLIEKIWGYDSEAEYNTIEVYVSFIRRKLLQVGSSTEIKSIRGVGYTLGGKND